MKHHVINAIMGEGLSYGSADAEDGGMKCPYHHGRGIPGLTMVPVTDLSGGVEGDSTPTTSISNGSTSVVDQEDSTVTVTANELVSSAIYPEQSQLKCPYLRGEIKLTEENLKIEVPSLNSAVDSNGAATENSMSMPSPSAFSVESSSSTDMIISKGPDSRIRPVLNQTLLTTNLSHVHFELAHLAALGRFTDFSPEISSCVFHLCIAAKLGNVMATVALGRLRMGLGTCILDGLTEYVPVDEKKAVLWLRRAAELGSFGAACLAAQLYARLDGKSLLLE